MDVPVRGGTLRTAVWGPDAAPVALAAHGITSSLVSWTAVGQVLAPDVRLVAPDLRGRGDSAALPGPYGMQQHAEDLIAVLDHLDVPRAVLVGHSMGGFVVAVAALGHADRVSRLVLVDGGPPLTGKLDPNVDVEAVLQAVIGPSLDRLRRTFTSGQECREFWRDHPAFRDGAVAPTLVDAYADYDLTGQPPQLCSKVSLDAVLADGRDLLVNELVRTATDRLTCPAVLLRAERGMLDDPQGLYGEQQAAAFTAAGSDREQRCVPDTNHYSIALGPHGADAVAGAVRAALAAG